MRVGMSHGSIGHTVIDGTMSVTLSGEQKIGPNTKYIMEHYRDEVGDIVCMLIVDGDVISVGKGDVELRMNDSPNYGETEHITGEFKINNKIRDLLGNE